MNEPLMLNNSVHLPSIGFGVFRSAPEESTAAVEAALRAGYRHIDTAAGYGNEREVGEGIHRSGLDRDDVFIETKVWVSDYGYDKTLHAFDKSALDRDVRGGPRSRRGRPSTWDLEIPEP